MNFNHFDESGHAIMVDVSAKQPTMRTAIATSAAVPRATCWALPVWPASWRPNGRRT